jgi:hypothetical protein
LLHTHFLSPSGFKKEHRQQQPRRSKRGRGRGRGKKKRKRWVRVVVALVVRCCLLKKKCGDDEKKKLIKFFPFFSSFLPFSSLQNKHFVAATERNTALAKHRTINIDPASENEKKRLYIRHSQHKRQRFRFSRDEQNTILYKREFFL